MGVVRLFHLQRKGNQVLFIICKGLISIFGRANVRAFHESPDRIYTDLTCISLKAHITKSRMFLLSAETF